MACSLDAAEGNFSRYLLCHFNPLLPYLLAGIAGLSSGVVKASHFRTYYTALNEQRDFIEALAAVRSLVSRLRSELGLDVYSFSVFHIFFEQYLGVWRDALFLLGGPLLAVFAVVWLFTSSLAMSTMLLLVLTNLMINLMGAMYLAGGC